MRRSVIASLIGGMAAAGASVVCVASMGAAATTTWTSLLTQVLRAVGRGGLTHLPTAALQAMALAGHHDEAGKGLYASIDVAVSEGGDGIGLAVLLRASVLLRQGHLGGVR